MPNRSRKSHALPCQFKSEARHFVILSDCLDFRTKFTSIARQLKRRRHQVSVLHILDAAEVEFPFSDLTIFEGMETSEEIQVDPRAVKKTYLNEFRAWMEHLRRSLLDGQVDYQRVRTDQALESYIFPLLESASR